MSTIVPPMSLSLEHTAISEARSSALAELEAVDVNALGNIASPIGTRISRVEDNVDMMCADEDYTRVQMRREEVLDPPMGCDLGSQVYHEQRSSAVLLHPQVDETATKNQETSLLYTPIPLAYENLERSVPIDIPLPLSSPPRPNLRDYVSAPSSSITQLPDVQDSCKYSDIGLKRTEEHLPHANPHTPSVRSSHSTPKAMAEDASLNAFRELGPLVDVFLVTPESKFDPGLASGVCKTVEEARFLLMKHWNRVQRELYGSHPKTLDAQDMDGCDCPACRIPTFKEVKIAEEEEWVQRRNRNKPVSNSPSPLPHVEMWWHVIQMIDDHRTLLACGCTCSSLRDICRRRIDHFRRVVLDDKQDVYLLHDRLHRNPMLAHFMRTANVFNASQLIEFLVEFMGKMPHINHLYVYCGGHSAGPCSLMSRALHAWKSVTMLALNDMEFPNFISICRVICALPSLRDLTLHRVSCCGRQGYSLTNMAFARCLQIEQLKVSGFPHWYLFTAPQLSRTITTLYIWVRGCLLGESVPSLQVHPIALLDNLQTFHCHVELDESAEALNNALPVFLSQMHHSTISSMALSFRRHHQLEEPQRLFGSGAEMSMHCLQALDKVLTSSHFSLLEAVYITIDNLHIADFVYLRSKKHLLFPLLRVRRILTFHIT
ncbi:hypothetical protein OBBRIDRAFT_890238 [Obba rivulosa]|uniref:Uncharacterized protein n=1 Tax=Obba rivulosa TaxID=1052685 RepID=A0A8E2ARS2_9APHY|nr:hypothetical protein OBBRIDRAFT_890238 [Obba rivulosa]